MKEMLKLSLPRLTEEQLTTVQTFSISGSEWKKYLEWRKEHNETCSISPQRQHEHFEETGEFLTGAIGGGETFSFSPNGIGVSVSVRCDKCEVEQDITDYNLW
jgi:hypothetical protein